MELKSFCTVFVHIQYAHTIMFTNSLHSIKMIIYCMPYDRKDLFSNEACHFCFI